MRVANLDARYCAWLVSNQKFPDPTWDMFLGLKRPAIILPRELMKSQPVDHPNMVIGTLVDVLGALPFEEEDEELCCVYKSLVICFGLNWKWKPLADTLK